MHKQEREGTPAFLRQFDAGAWQPYGRGRSR